MVERLQGTVTFGRMLDVIYFEHFDRCCCFPNRNVDATEKECGKQILTNFLWFQSKREQIFCYKQKKKMEERKYYNFGNHTKIIQAKYLYALNSP